MRNDQHGMHEEWESVLTSLRFLAELKGERGMQVSSFDLVGSIGKLPRMTLDDKTFLPFPSWKGSSRGEAGTLSEISRPNALDLPVVPIIGAGDMPFRCIGTGSGRLGTDPFGKGEPEKILPVCEADGVGEAS